MEKFTGNQLKLIRKFFALTQMEMASLLGSHQATISKSEDLENTYLADKLNAKLNEGLKRNDIEPDAMNILITEFESTMKQKYEQIGRV